MERNGYHFEEENSCFDTGNLSPIEHKMIGSSVILKGEKIDIEGLLKKVEKGDEQALKILLTPIDILDGKSTVEEVRRQRTREIEKKTKLGYASFLELDQMFELADKCQVWVEPANLNIEGQVEPKWKVHFLDFKGNAISCPVQKLELGKEFRKVFKITSKDLSISIISLRNEI